MRRGTAVPINNQVLQWAIAQSGLSELDLATRVNVPVETLRQWQSGDLQPSITQFNHLCNVLRRPSATFFLPEPPDVEPVEALFRSSSKEGQRSLTPDELNVIRTSEHLQEIVAWLLAEQGAETVQLTHATLEDSPVTVAEHERKLFRVSIDRQTSWTNERHALREWRLALESKNVLVFQLTMGARGVPGFVLWNEFSPLITVNSGYAVSNRIFSLFHEYAHLLLRESNIDFSLRELATDSNQSPTERWCDRFSASFLMPESDIRLFVETQVLLGIDRSVSSTRQVRRVATRYRVSRSAAVRRLRDLGLASHELVQQVDRETRPSSGGGGGGDRRPRIRIRQFGTRVPEILLDALDRNQLARHEVLDYLGLNLDDLPAIEDELESTPQ